MKSQYMALVLSMSALTACGGGGGGTTEPTTPQPTTPNVQEQTHNSVTTKTAKADLLLLAVTNFDDPVDGNSGRFQVEAGENGVSTYSFSDGGDIDFEISSDSQPTNANDPGGVLKVIRSDDYFKTLVFVTNGEIYTAGIAAEIGLGTGAVAAFESGTQVGAIENIETATYNGTLLGVLVQENKRPAQSYATSNAAVNFNDKTMTVTSSNTSATDVYGQFIGTYLSHDFSTTLTDLNSDHTFEGTLTDAEGKTGTMTASLSGFNAEGVTGSGYTSGLVEINGVLSERAHVFAFGAQR